MVIFLALIVTLVTVLYFVQDISYKFWKNRGIPQIKPSFPFGNVQRHRHFVYAFYDAYQKYKGKSKYVGLYSMLTPVLQVLDEDVIKQMLIKDFSSFSSRGFYYNEIDDPLSAHLLALDSEEWRVLRGQLTPTFSSGKMKLMCPIVTQIGQRLKGVMDDTIENGQLGIDMKDMIARFTTDVIGTCAFGLECDTLNNPDAIFREMGLECTQFRHSQFVFILLTAFPNLGRKLHAKITKENVEKFFLKIVHETVEYRLKNKIVRNDFMDLLINLLNNEKSNSIQDSQKDGLSMNQITAQCFLFFVAGFDTSSTNLTYAIFELAQNQTIQDKLRQHIRDILKKHNGELTYEALNEMTYLHQCIDEALRKWPPISAVRRKVTQAYKLPDTNVILPKDTLIMIPIYAMHRDARTFPNPEEFDPERFTEEEIAKRHPMAYLPFGHGPRNCIAARFGLMQTRIGLAYLIGNFRFKLNSKTNPCLSFKKEALLLVPDQELLFDVEKV